MPDAATFIKEVFAQEIRNLKLEISKTYADPDDDSMNIALTYNGEEITSVDFRTN